MIEQSIEYKRARAKLVVLYGIDEPTKQQVCRFILFGRI